MTRLRAHRLIFAILWGAAVSACREEAECGDCFDQGYSIKPYIGEDGTELPLAVLFSGWRNGWCQKNLLCTGTPEVLLGELSSGPLDYPCDEEELIAFSAGHAPTIAQVARATTELSVPLNARSPVHVTLWIVNGVVSQADAQFDADYASGVYADFGTGIDLIIDIEDFPRARLEEVDGDPGEGNLYAWANCDLINRLSRMAEQGDGYQPGFRANQLNVYYVAEINPSYAAGIYCGYPPYSRQDIMFVDGNWDSHPAALAHELGHAFGLRRGVTLPDASREQYGHVDDLELDPYLPDNNLMESDVFKVEQITVGQIYRMHYDELSWLWYGQAHGPVYPLTCQSSPVEGNPCPPLTLHVRGWP